MTILFQKIKMQMDFSDKGREEYYKKVFDRVGILKNETATFEGKYKILLLELEKIRSYESQKKMYNEQMKMYWDIKKNFIIKCHLEKETLGGVVSHETQEKGEDIKKYEQNLRKISSNFDEDLEKIVMNDPDVRNITLNPN